MNELYFDLSSSTKDQIPIIQQLSKICSSDDFKTKKLLCKFLSFIVTESLAGCEYKLKGYSIGVDVFGKGEDFDADHDALVRIHAGRLRRTLTSYYKDAGKNDAVIIEIPVGGYKPVFLINKYAEHADEVQTSLIVEKTIPSRPTLGLLPFKNLTGKEHNEFLTHGFVEELSIELTRYEDLKVYDCVPGSNSLYNQTDTNRFIKEKGIHFVLEGSINQVGNQITVLAKLTDVKKEAQIWAQRYKKEISPYNLIETQEKIAQSIALIIGNEFGIIMESLAKENRIKPKEYSTYAAIQKFYYYSLVVTTQAGEEAFIALSKALEKEPDSGLAMACLGVMHSDSYVFDQPIDPNSYELFGELAEQAARLDPNSSLVNTILAVKYFIHNEKELFKAHFDKCLNIISSRSLNAGSLAFHYMCFGWWDHGKKIMDEVISNNFKYPSYFHAATFLYYYRLEDYEQALKEVNLLNLPEVFWSPMLRIAVMGQLKKGNEAAQSIEQLLQIKPDFKEKAAYLISRFVKEDELVEHVMEGIRNAGMQV